MHPIPARINTMKLTTDRAHWSAQQKGDFGEALAQLYFTRCGCYLYTRKRDDHGVDFVVETPDGAMLKVQVKTLTPSKTNPYVMIKKAKLKIAEDMLLFVVMLSGDTEQSFLIPSTVFAGNLDGTPFSDWHNEAKGEPVWQVRLTPTALKLLAPYAV